MFLGNSLTEGVPHYNGETDTVAKTDTVAIQVSQRYPGSTYTKLGYRSQTSEHLLGRLGFLLDLHKPDSDHRNILILWAGTNDCALIQDCVSGTYNNLSAIGRVATAIGWKVVVVTIIARNNYFAPGVDAVQFSPTELIHDWAGAIFIPKASMGDVMRVVRDYDRYQAIYHPNVAGSKPIETGECEDRFSMVIMNKSFFAKSALDSDYRSIFTRRRTLVQHEPDDPGSGGRRLRCCLPIPAPGGPQHGDSAAGGRCAPSG